MIGRRRSTGAAVALALCATTLSACGDDGSSATVEVPNVFDLRADPAAEIAPVDLDRADVLPAGTLRAVLERQLAWHGITLVEMMRVARRDDPQMQAWIDALADNTNDLVAAVGLVYGPVGARAFNQQWGQHTQFLLDYAVAVRDGDDKAADLARSNLATYAADSGSFFAAATNGALPAEAVQELLETHIGHMYEMIAADADGDRDTTLDAALRDNDYLLGVADGLATAMAGQQAAAFTGDIETETSMFCTIVTGRTGSLVLTGLISDEPTAVDAAAAAFDDAVGEPVDEVFGPLGPLSDNDLSTVAATADGMLDRALEYATTGR